VNHLRELFIRSTVAVEDAADSLVGELVRLAATELENGNIEQAERYLRQGLSRNPADHQCQAYLAVCDATRDPRSRAAERSAREVVTLHPTDPVAYFALGHVYLLASRRREAFRMFQRARKLARRDRALTRRLERVDPRRAPVIAALPRDHPLNILAGRLRVFFGRPRRG